MTKSKASGRKGSSPNGSVVVSVSDLSGSDLAGSDRPRERVFGGRMPDGPLPGRLLVLLSRLHRAEAARERPGPGRN